MMVKELEGLLKNTLKNYIMILEGNGTIKEREVDYSVTMTKHNFSAKDIKEYDADDPKFDKAREMDGKPVLYLRIAKIIKEEDKHVLYAGYRLIGSAKPEAIKRILLMDAVRNLMYAGLQYNDMIYQNYLAEQEIKGEIPDKEPEGGKKDDEVTDKKS